MNNNTAERLCKISGCKKRVKARGYCSMHYERLRKFGDPNKVLMAEEKNKYIYCTVEGCGEKHSAKGFCEIHYARWKRLGDPNAIIRIKRKGKVCIVPGCDDEQVSVGYCLKHLQRFKRNGHVKLKNRHELCTIKGCEEKHFARGLCYQHYNKSGYAAESRNRRRSRLLGSPINDFTEEDWQKCLNAFNWECAYCGAKTDKLEQEHVVPVSKNGANTKTNIVPSCRPCNMSKRITMLETWYPKQHFYNRKREEKILKWMGYKINGNKIQMQLF